MTSTSNAPSSIALRPVSEGDREWVRALIEREWGSAVVVSRGRLHDPTTLPGLVALLDGERAGLVTYRIEDGECEVVSLNSLREGMGIGATLLGGARSAAKAAGCTRVWLITTNDNLKAVRFYQRRGWDLVALHRDALRESRRLKPDIPELGEEDIPLKHELEFELRLA